MQVLCKTVAFRLLLNGGDLATLLLNFFYVDFIEAGNTKRASFVLRTKEQVEMLRASQLRSIMVRITQRVATFKKGSLNIVFESATDHR